MQTPPGQSPALLPPPKRRFVGKRINRVPAAIAVGVGLIVAGSVAYTMYERGEQETDQGQTEAEPAPSDASSILKDRPSGYIQPAAIHLNPFPKVEGAASSTPAAPPANPPEDDNGLEKERKAAWDRYWAEYEDIRKKRFEQRQAALTAKSSIASVQTSGETPTGANAAPIASAPTLSIPSGLPGIGGYGGWSGFAGLPGLGGFGYGLGPAPQIDNAAQRQKIEFANQQGDLGRNDVIAAGRLPPDPYALTAGSYVKFTTETKVNSDVPGSEIGRVTETVSNYDGSCILIPQGSKLIGQYNSQVSAGQSRLPGVLTKIVFPDGSEQPIGAQEVADNAGSAGMEDQIDRHLLEKFGSAFVAGLFGASIQLSVPNEAYGGGYTAPQIIGASLGQQMGQLGQQIAQQNLSIPNTATIRAGYNGTMINDKRIQLGRPWSCAGSTNGPPLPIMSNDQ